MASKRIYSIDLLRMLSAFLVVCLHSTDCIWRSSISPIARTAVPLFFIISGYFFSQQDNKKRKKQILHILMITALSNLLYLGYKLLCSFSYDGPIEYLKNLYTTEKIVDFLLFNQSPFGYHLWFLSALLFTMIFAFICSKIKIDKFMVIAIPLLLIANLYFETHQTFGEDNEVIRNFIFIGIPFFFIGYLLWQADIASFYFSNTLLISLIIIFSTISILEKNYLIALSGKPDLYFSTTFLSITVFLFAINCPLSDRGKVVAFLAKYSRKYSLMIYIVQIIVIEQINKLVEETSFFKTYSYISPFVAFFASLLISIIFYLILIPFKKLKKLKNK